MLSDLSTSENVIRRCITLCGRIHSHDSRNLLLSVIDIPSQTLYMQVLDSLTRINYKIEKEDKENIEQKLIKEIDLTLYIIQSMFVLNESKKYKNTVHALNLELRLIQSRVFSLLTFIYPKQPLLKSREGLSIHNSDVQSIAVEALEILIKDSQYKIDIITVMDPHLPLGEKQKRLEQRTHQIRVCDDSIIDRILFSKTQEFSKWTIASVLYDKQLNNEEVVSKEDIHLSDHPLIKQIIAPMENQNHLINFEKILLLRTTDIFSETPENILLDLADIMEEVEVKANQVVFEKGAAGYDMFIIHKGAIEIKDKDHILTTLSEKDFFGELSLLDPEPRSATALAIQDSVLFRIDQEAFYEIMSDRVEVAKGIMKVLCRRLRAQNERVILGN